ncbi:MAG: hypothetical protein IJK64_09900 [Clostridia bacterium]|nr:hypothetical protein [Clostridia bacterium]
MKECKAFSMKNARKQEKHLRGLITVESFGDFCNGHLLHMWDDGCRLLKRCPACDALVLVQRSEFHSFTDGNDSYYTDFFPVASRQEALELNEKYDGFQLENAFPGKHIFW